jgi:mannose-6-phosphate isomerase-like protein (cupin superfamily)
MAEVERTRERERPPIKENPYELSMRFRQELAERNRTGKVVVKSSDREVFVARQGRIQYFLNPFAYKDTPLQNWLVFKHEIRTRSGKHRHQGGLVIYVLEGKGYSVIDGERVDWEKGDLLLLPLHEGGVEHQHFNTQPGTPALWVAFIPIPITEHLAYELEQIEESPEYQGG